MLDKGVENKLAPLEPVIERAGSTSTSSALNSFGNCLDGAASRMVR